MKAYSEKEMIENGLAFVFGFSRNNVRDMLLACEQGHVGNLRYVSGWLNCKADYASIIERSKDFCSDCANRDAELGDAIEEFEVALEVVFRPVLDYLGRVFKAVRG